jgi:hypothetical protein
VTGKTNFFGIDTKGASGWAKNRFAYDNGHFAPNCPKLSFVHSVSNAPKLLT